MKKKARKRSFRRIDCKERVKIERRYRTDRWRIGTIATELKRPSSAVSREIGEKPHLGRGRYGVDRAQKRADENSARQIKLILSLLSEHK